MVMHVKELEDWLLGRRKVASESRANTEVGIVSRPLNYTARYARRQWHKGERAGHFLLGFDGEIPAARYSEGFVQGS
jgi:hypothetical protein